MTAYVYKGFNIKYSIKKIDNNMYQAFGKVSCKSKNRTALSKMFQTEYPTKVGVENEIKKLIEDYINFEWKEYLDMKEEAR